MSQFVVIGGSGVLGRQVTAALARRLPAAEVVVASRSGLPEHRRWIPVDARSRRSVRAAVDGADAVIVAAGHPDAAVQEACLDVGAHCVDVGVGAALAGQVASLDERARVRGVLSVTMAGLVPGVSGLLVRHAAGAVGRVKAVDVRFRQSANAAVGRSGTADMLRLVAGRTGTSGRSRFWLQHPDEPALRQFDHPEQPLIEGRFPGTAVRYWTGWDDRRLTAAVAALARARALPRFATLLAGMPRHDPRRPQAVSITATVRGDRSGVLAERSRTVTADSDYGATAAAAVGLTALALGGTHGAGVPMDLVDLDDLVSAAEPGSLRVHDGPRPG